MQAAVCRNGDSVRTVGQAPRKENQQLIIGGPALGRPRLEIPHGERRRSNVRCGNPIECAVHGRRFVGIACPAGVARALTGVLDGVRSRWWMEGASRANQNLIYQSTGKRKPRRAAEADGACGGGAEPQASFSTMMVPRCNPCFSISRYSVVRSTPAIRAAFDMLPSA